MCSCVVTVRISARNDLNQSQAFFLNLLTLLKYDHVVILVLKFQWKRSRIGGTGFGNPERGVTPAISIRPIINRALRR